MTQKVREMNFSLLRFSDPTNNCRAKYDDRNGTAKSVRIGRQHANSLREKLKSQMTDSADLAKKTEGRSEHGEADEIHSQKDSEHLMKDVSVPITLGSDKWNNEGKSVTWIDVTVKVPLAKKSLLKCLKIVRESRKTKTILNKVSGYAMPGTTLAIMGSSGTGKTVLLNALTMNVSSNVDVKGKILVNGEELSSTDMHRISRYVHQDDVFIGTLTVREQLIYSAELQMGHTTTKADRLKRVEEVLKELGLKKCETTLIGVTNRLKGISCGESKRLAFACEILTDPLILFCDEPTSGLDSFMAVQVVNCLKDMAKKGKTIITTIHQPSSQVFNMFDNVCFMAMGKVVYFGPVTKVCKFFKNIGFTCPETYNPADHIIKTLSVMQNEQECQTRVDKIRIEFEKSTFGMMLHRKSRGQELQKKMIGNKDLEKRKMYAVSFLSQFLILVRRSFLTIMRDPLLLKVKFIQVIVTALVIGMVNFQTQITGPTIMNLEGILYNTVRDMNFIFLFPSISVITSELPIFLREHCCSRIYSAQAYYLAKSVAELPEYTILPLCYAIIVYFMSGLHLAVKAFVTYCTITVVLTNLAVSIGKLLVDFSVNAFPFKVQTYAGACIFGEDSLALTYMPCFILPNLVFGGFYVNFHSIPIYYQFISYISWFRFGFEALQVNQWLNYRTIPGCEEGATSVINYCPAYSGNGILERRGMDTSQTVILNNLIVLIVMLIGFRVIGLIALLLRVRLTK
ncbi:ABC-2 type transporter family protein [Acanthocheilonema viteae]